MRVLVASAARGIPLYGPSGASAHLRGIAGALSRAGHDVVVAVPRLRDARPAVGSALDAEVVVCAPPARRGPRWRRELAEVRHSRAMMRAVSGPVDLVWERHSLHSDGPWRWARARRIPRIVEVNAPLLLERTLRDPVALPGLAARLERQSLRHAVRAAVVSSWLVPWARALGATEVRQIPNGTEPRTTAPAPRPCAPLLMGYVGSCPAWHELDRLPRLLDLLPDAQAMVIGDGPCPPPPHPRLRRLPPVDDPMPWVHTWDVALAPGHAPPWVSPLKLLDYRAAGVPVVSSPAGDSRALVADAGEIVPHEATDAQWAAAIRRQAGRTVTPWQRTWDQVVDEALRDLSASR